MASRDGACEQETSKPLNGRYSHRAWASWVLDVGTYRAPSDTA